MDIQVKHQVDVEVREVLTANTVGRTKVAVPHRMLSRMTETYDGVWSDIVDVPAMVTLDLTNLPETERASSKDLFTNQEIGQMRVRNVGSGIATILYKMESGETLENLVLMPGRDQWSRAPVGHIMGQAFKTIEIMAIMTGPTAIEIVLNSRKRQS